MGQHTPETWLRSSDDFVVAESDQLNGGEYILSCFGPDQESNGRRIVACVNACRTRTTEQLEMDDLEGYEPWGHVEHLRQQRNELLAALEHLHHNAKASGAEMGLALDVAEEAIVKAKGCAA